MKTTAPEARSTLTIAWLMVQVAAAAFVMLGLPYARDAVAAADPSNYSGDSNAQDMEVLVCLLPAFFFFALSGVISALGLRRLSPDSSRLPARAWKLFRRAAFPMLTLVILPMPTLCKVIIWGAVIFTGSFLWVATRPRSSQPSRLRLLSRLRARPSPRDLLPNETPSV